MRLTEDRVARDLGVEVDEGILLADSAVRMAMKNHLIVEMLSGEDRWRPESHRSFARDVLLRIADEQSAAATRMARAYELAVDSGGGPANEHDYRELDLGLLAKRRQVYRAVAVELRRRAGDGSELSGVVEGARADAWFEVGAAIERRLDLEVLPSAGLNGRLADLVRVGREQESLKQQLAAEVRSRQPPDVV